MKLVHFMVVIAFASFEVSKWKHKVALYWIKIDILNRFSENLSSLCFGTVDV